MEARQFLHRILEDPKETGNPSRYVRGAIFLLIIANGLAVVLESVDTIRTRWEHVFLVFERLSIAMFTVEYVLRLWSVTADPRYSRPIMGRMRFAFTPFAVLDLLAVLPAYVPWLIAVDLRTLRLLRLLRVFRLLKLARYSTAVRSLASAFRDRHEEIGVVMFVLIILLIVSSSLMYHIENEAQPDKFSSIPAAMYWGMATVTTVGYGDMCPVTVMGRFLSMVIAVLGTGLFALPTAIWGTAFVERLLKSKAQERICPHCGKAL